MYVRDSAACSLPNSQMPMTAARIAHQYARVARAGKKFTDGNRALYDLIRRLGGNPGSTTPGDAGVPTTGSRAGSPWAWPPWNEGKALSLPWDLTSGFPWQSGGSGGGGRRRPAGPESADCVPVEVLPVVTVFPIPAVVPAATPSTPTPQPAMLPAASPQPALLEDPCVGLPVCEAWQKGCFVDGQLSMAQKYACSLAGWSANRSNVYGWIQLKGGAYGGKRIGTVDLNPPTPAGNRAYASVEDSPASSIPAGLSGEVPSENREILTAAVAGTLTALLTAVALNWLGKKR